MHRAGVPMGVMGTRALCLVASQGESRVGDAAVPGGWSRQRGRSVAQRDLPHLQLPPWHFTKRHRCTHSTKHSPVVGDTARPGGTTPRGSPSSPQP